MEINNWDDWFKNCGDISPDMKEYETVAGNYFDTQFPNTEKGKQLSANAFQDYHKVGFYKNAKLFPIWYIKNVLIRYLKVALLFFIAFMVFFGINVFLLKKGAMMLSIMIQTSVFAGISFAMPWIAIPLIARIFKMQKLCNKLKKMENNMIDRVQCIPPKYRNSLATESIYSLYCNYGVKTFDQAIASCDDYLKSNNFVAAYMAILFDVPYTNMNGETMDADDIVEDVNDPNLPDDIQTKRHSGFNDAYEQLDRLIGLKNVKQQIKQMKNRMDFYDNTGSEKISGNHMVFLGSPGTGKTTIARILTKILYDFGYIKQNKVVEIDGGYLKSPYVGQTTERANAIIRYAMGGVLFIDEAYLLLDSDGDAGQQAAGVLLKAMEDYKNEFVVIMAGYEDNINRLLSSNEGFASRIKYKIYFEDFSVDEMIEIFKMQLNTYSKNDTYLIDNDALTALQSLFEKEKRIPGFGNARVVRNALDAILDNHADHFMNNKLNDDQKYIITKMDVMAYIEKRYQQMQDDGRNFIANNNLDSSVISLQELKGKTKTGSKDPDKALQNLIGLDMVKNEIKQMKAQFEFYDGNIENEGNHMVFLGPPGTGKTTVVSIMTGYLYQLGLINENSYLDINGDFLRGMYVGHTGKRTEAIVQYAQGMVLFIDEAYLLNSTDSNGDSDSFGAEAIGVLLDAMEKYRKNFIVIFAGYEDEMDKFLDMNSGLRSRISLEFHFKAYTPREMAQIFQRTAKRNHFKVQKEAYVPMQHYFHNKMQEPQFGNGRFVRQFFELCKKSHIANYSQGKYDQDNKYLITCEDVEMAIGKKG